MLPGSDEVEFLIQTSVALLERDGDQILPEITCCGVDEEAEAVSGLDLDAGEGKGCGVVEGVGLCG
jgi:hypothetical protein